MAIGFTATRFPARHIPRYWESLGNLLKDGRLGSIVEVVRIQDNGITVDLAGLAACTGLEISWIVVVHCLRSSG